MKIKCLKCGTDLTKAAKMLGSRRVVKEIHERQHLEEWIEAVNDYLLLQINEDVRAERLYDGYVVVRDCVKVVA